MPLHLDTPLFSSPALGITSGRSIWLKMEALQPCGSFKLRGIGAACQHHMGNGKRRFVSSSGGNAGIAVAYAGQCLSIPVSVFVPETTSEKAKQLIRQQGADVYVHGTSWQEANERALLAVDADTAFIHPFDDPLLWAGHASMIDEVARSGVAFDAVVLSVGGGGLMCGVAEGLKRNGIANTPIIAVETRGAASLAESIAAGARIELPAITSVATSLGARRVCERAFDLTKEQPIESVVVEDGAAITACIRFLDDHRVLVEPACGAALAIAYDHPEKLAAYDQVLIIVCGGATTSLPQLNNWHSSNLYKP